MSAGVTLFHGPIVACRSITFGAGTAGREPDFGLRACHSAHSLSMKAWWSQNTGSLGEAAVAMWPPTHTWTRLCRLTPRQPSRWLRNPFEELFQGAAS